MPGTLALVGRCECGRGEGERESPGMLRLGWIEVSGSVSISDSVEVSEGGDSWLESLFSLLITTFRRFERFADETCEDRFARRPDPGPMEKV